MTAQEKYNQRLKKRELSLKQKTSFFFSKRHSTKPIKVKPIKD